MAYVPNSGSVVAFQTTASNLNVAASIIGTVPIIRSGQTGTVITSVSGIVNVAGSVLATQGTNPWIITGSVQATAAANQSVSGTVGASIIGQLPAGTAVLGSIMALQGTNPWVIVGSVQGATNQSISGTVGASIIGNVPVVVQSSVAVAIISGSIAASFTPPANQSVSGTVQVDVRGSVAAVIIGGSIATATTNSSVMLLNGANTIGSVTTLQGTNPWIVTGSVQGVMSVLGTVPVTQSTTPWITTMQASVAVAIISGSIAATFTPPANQSVSGAVSVSNFPTNQNVSGSVVATQGTNPWIVTSSVAGGLFPISGSVAATIVGTPNVNTAGSVVAFQGTSPWVVNFQNSSIIAIQSGSVVSLSVGSVITVWKDSSVLSVPVGSVITVFQTPSIVGTYAEDAASASGDKGFLVMGARNDTLSSVTSADGDYSSHVVGPAGELIAANAPFTKWVSGTASALGGSPTTGSLIPVIAAQGASVFTYITGVQITNASGTNAWITLLGGTNSVIGYTVAPANGGSNIYYQNGLKTNANAIFSASVSAVSSIYVSAQGFIAKI